MNAFFDQDGGRAYGARQCRWKPSQKQTFIEAIRMRFAWRAWRPSTRSAPEFDHANTGNEVNMYVDPQGTLARALWGNLLGIVYVRTAGNDDELRFVHRLGAHWASLGYPVPMFALSAEAVDGTIRHWRDGVSVDLEQPPYSLQQLH